MKLRIGVGSCGIAAGALNTKEALESKIKSLGLEVEVSQTGCIGMCHNEPLLDVLEDDGRVYTYGMVTPEIVGQILESHIQKNIPVEKYLVASPEQANPFQKGQVKIVLKNSGVIDPESIDEYIAHDGYRALNKCLTEMSPEEVIEELKISGLRGRGGAGFPTWFKWNATRKAKGDLKYIVCNADEGDPGAFMDRSTLEGDPHAVLEGMMIAGYVAGAKEGVIYCRAEYPLAIRRLETAIASAKERKLLGENILGTDFSFDIYVKQGAGAFVCGEETALIASLEGERGMPRLKPPFPSDSGYWGMPTNINNVETFANVPWIIREGGSAFAAMGTEKSKGTKVFALAGKIKLGGLIEVPMGITLRQVIYEVGGGIKEDKKFKAVQMGGPSGGCIPAEYLDTPIDYESVTALGAIMGSGGMVVMDETTCMVDIARYFLDFTQKESCGKCVQCRLGTKRMLEILERICRGEGKPEDIDLLEEICVTVRDGSLCGLGMGAPNPILTTLKYFKDEYEAHIYDKKCPAKQCRALITYQIDAEQCRGCTLCAKKCPVQCISGEKQQAHTIEQALCTKCGTCLEVCPFSAVYVD